MREVFQNILLGHCVVRMVRDKQWHKDFSCTLPGNWKLGMYEPSRDSKQATNGNNRRPVPSWLVHNPKLKDFREISSGSDSYLLYARGVRWHCSTCIAKREIHKHSSPGNSHSQNHLPFLLQYRFFPTHQKPTVVSSSTCRGRLFKAESSS